MLQEIVQQLRHPKKKDFEHPSEEKERKKREKNLNPDGRTPPFGRLACSSLIGCLLVVDRRWVIRSNWCLKSQILSPTAPILQSDFLCFSRVMTPSLMPTGPQQKPTDLSARCLFLARCFSLLFQLPGWRFPPMACIQHGTALTSAPHGRCFFFQKKSPLSFGVHFDAALRAMINLSSPCT